MSPWGVSYGFAVLILPSCGSCLWARLIHLGKFGAFPSSHLLGLHYDITYEIIPDPTSTGSSGSGGQESEQAQRGFGQGQSKKNKKQKKGGLGNVDAEAGPSGAFKSHPGWGYTVRPLKRQAVGDAIIGQLLLSLVVLQPRNTQGEGAMAHKLTCRRRHH